MQEYEGLRKGGTFVLSSGAEVQGELCLNREASILNLYSNKHFDTHSSRDVFGVFYDRSKVSLIDCTTLQGPGSGIKGCERYHFSNVFPHFAIFGKKHISSYDRIVDEVSFTVDDAATLFYDFDAFGQVINARPHMEKIAGEQTKGKKIDIGEHPHIFYFSGKHQILSIYTVLGNISVQHSISYSSPGPKGIHLSNTIKINIAFNSVMDIDDAVIGIFDVLRFLEVLAGRPKNVSNLTFISESSGKLQEIFEVYWCIPPRRDFDSESRKPHPADLPIKGAMNPDEFSSVLNRWLERNREWRSARARFSESFAYQNRYRIDRLVGAANMFDILPTSIFPEDINISSNLKQATEKARKEFKALSASPERDSILASSKKFVG